MGKSKKGEPQEIIPPVGEGVVKKAKKRRVMFAPDLDCKLKSFDAKEEEEKPKTFKDFYLEERLLKAIAKLGWKQPTSVQESVIPLILEDKNVLARARTGTGKTAAFLLPIIQKIVQSTATEAQKGALAVIIVPTKELASQIFNLCGKLTTTFPFLESVNLAELNDAKQKASLENDYSIIVSTPSRLVAALDQKASLLENVKHVVLDEADLLFSFGYEDDMKKLKKKLPARYGTIMTSATITDDLSDLKTLFVVGPIVSIKLKEGLLPSVEQLTQYQINSSTEEEKYAVLLSMLRLKLMVGKAIFFVGDVDQCYKLQLFLQCFKIRTCVLNPEMPANNRSASIQAFNEGKFNYIIATDCNDVDEGVVSDLVDKKKKRRAGQTMAKHDNESGVARGIDFHHVSNVINFNCPGDLSVYVHRVGRTARGFNKGTSITFVLPEEEDSFIQIRNDVNEAMGAKVILPYEVRMVDLDTFLLRSREALSGCTRGVIRETRLSEIKKEILKSKKLEGYFTTHTADKSMIEQDKSLRKVRVQTETLHAITDYMVPAALRGMDLNPVTYKSGKGGQHKKKSSAISGLFKKDKKKGNLKKFGKKSKVDPLDF
uniref:RNA helicase n=1 Tax=Rhabditophanes sp. KR3021 TaxID=114890 RepID=A0AC35UEF9_9BILA